MELISALKQKRACHTLTSPWTLPKGKKRRLAVWKRNKGFPLGTILSMCLLHDTLSPTVSPSEPVLKSEDRYAGFILPRFEKKIVAPCYVLKFGAVLQPGTVMNVNAV